MDLERALARIVELGREELSIVRKRAEEKTPARDHGHDLHEMERAADRLDHVAHTLRRLHDQEFGSGWRHESRSDPLAADGGPGRVVPARDASEGERFAPVSR